jgi:cell division protein FtsZ
MAQVKPDIESFARIKVIGVGGGGGNAVTRMMRAKIRGVDFIAINTDAQDLHHAEATEKIHIGKNVTRGLGAGMNPELGRLAAEENKAEIQEALKGADMVFVTCGLGGGTGSGAAPVVADIAREMGAVTIGIVTKPFGFEGKQRTGIAEDSMKNMQDKVDSLIVIPNDKVLAIIDKKTSLMSAFETIDDILKQGVQGISDLITYPGIVNVDFADVKAIMEEAGPALIGIGRATGEDRATKAARMAIHSPLLEIAINGAQGVLFNISGGTDLGMLEVSEAANVITESVGGDAKIIFGAIHDDRLRKGEIKVTVIATGFGREGAKKEPNLFTRTAAQPQMQAPVPPASAHRVVVEDKNAKKYDTKQAEEADEWEIPAFIRKKK